MKISHPTRIRNKISAIAGRPPQSGTGRPVSPSRDPVRDNGVRNPDANDHITITELQSRLNYYKSLLDYAPDLIVSGDVEERIVEVNPAVEKILGYRKEELLGRPVKNLYFHPHERDHLIRLLRKHGSVVDYDIRIKAKDGKIIPMSTTIAYVRNKKGNIIGTIGIAKDISRRKHLENELRKMAVTDGLTNLYDRGYFDRRIDHAVRSAHRFKKSLWLIMIDLDGFKKYNDNRGHLMGDKILHQVGRTILRTIQQKVDSCYRYGGDEFVILVPESHISPRDLAEEIRVEIELAFGPTITASIGIAKLQRGQSVYDLIKSADEAMYKAKSLGGNRVFYV